MICNGNSNHGLSYDARMELNGLLQQRDFGKSYTIRELILMSVVWMLNL
jgi:hypothetical protein